MSGNKPLLSALLATLCLAAIAQSDPAPAPSEGAAAQIDGAAPAAPAVIPALSASSDPDRALVDIPLAAADPDAAPAALVIEFGAPVPVESVRGVTIHLRSRGGWLSASLPAARARGSVRLPFGSFAPEGSAGPAAEADLVRISLWRLAPDSDTPSIAIPSVRLAPSADVAVVRATEATAPGETAFATQMAARLERILTRAGIPFDSIEDTALAGHPGGSGGGASRPLWLLLPYAPRLSHAHIAALRAHISAGGRVAAFYNGSAELSALLGLAPPRYEHSRTGWRAMAWGKRRIPHHTENLHVPVVKKGAEATVLATWVDADGAQTALPAVVATRHGALFAHIPPLAYPAAQDLLRTLVAQPHEGAAAQVASTAPEAKSPPLPSLPIIGAWSDTHRLPDRIPPALNTLYTYLSAVPAPVAGGAGGAAPRPSQAVHIWLPLLNPVDRPDSHWLDPTNPEDRAAALRRVRAAVRRNPAGIHFDYVRSPSGTPASPKAAAAVTELLREAAALARDLSPSIVLSAAVFPTPASAAEHNQDWPAWLREGLLDYVAPMLYDDDPAAFRASLAQCLAAAPADRLVAGIGTGADEAQVDAEAFAAGVTAAAEAGLRGVCFFPLDDALLELLGGAK